MTISEIEAQITFFLTVFGSFLALAIYVLRGFIALDREIKALKAEGAATKLHVAENYVHRDDLWKIKEEIMAAIAGVKSGVDQMTARVDRIVENHPMKP